MRVKHIEDGKVAISEAKEIYKKNDYLCIPITGVTLRYKMPETRMDELIDRMFETGALDMTSYERTIGPWG